MEILKKIPETVRTLTSIGLVALVGATPIEAVEANPPQINVTVRCTSEPAYGVVEMGRHAVVKIEAIGLDYIKPELEGGTWLYVEQIHSATQRPLVKLGYAAVAYGGSRSSFSTSLDGFVYPIRPTTSHNVDSQPITFMPGDTFNLMFRRGPYTTDLPITDSITEPLTVELNCLAPQN